MARDLSAPPERPDPADVIGRPERFRGGDRPTRVPAPVGEVLQPYARRLDQPDRPRRPDQPNRPGTPSGDTPREAIRRFDPERAGLDPMTKDEATQHVTEHAADRPWLNHAQYVGPDTRRVLASLDKGAGHALERHGSTVTPDMTESRVTHLKDPAIPDEAARTPGKDAYRRGTHACGDTATRIRDPHAFATCFARGIEHPRVRAELDKPVGAASRARRVTVPLHELLGEVGHEYCDGHRLEPVDGSLRAAQDRREAYVAALRDGRKPDVPEPVSRRLTADDFRDADVVFMFRPTRDKKAWEVATMYVEPNLSD